MDWIKNFSCYACVWPTRCKPVCHAVMSVALLVIACNVSRKQGKCPSWQRQRADDPCVGLETKQFGNVYVSKGTMDTAS